MAGQRSPAERAFDFIFLPGVLYVALSGFAQMFRLVKSDGEPVLTGWPVLALQAFAWLAMLHWLIATRKVLRSWRDPFGKVLRFVSAFLLVMAALAVGSALLL
jgi:hypothetical protein